MTNDTAFDCAECDRNAVGVVKVDGTTRYLCQSHYRSAIAEYAPAIEDKRLLPGGHE